VKRGEIRWAEHPDWPRRPALILTRDEAIDHLNAVFVVLATTNIRGLATEVELGTEGGMPRPCVLNADNTATIAKSYLRRPITTISSTKLREICQALSHATGC
jgi:mRNA interferase MazF